MPGGNAANTPDNGPALKTAYASDFPIGTAVGAWHLDNVTDILTKHFNHLTAENAMKTETIHPAEATFNWVEADRIAKFGRDNGMKLAGHTFVWHRAQPAWLFSGVTAGDATSLATLKARLKTHIEALIERYGDVVDNWDIVNEAISDDSAKRYRDGAEGSQWFALAGEEYIAWAFQLAREALETREPGSSKGKLYYNDYSMTLKVDRVLAMAAWLKNDKGITIDGIGFQGHYNLTWPSVKDLQAAFDKIIAAGYRIKISELDLTVYSDYHTGSFKPQPMVNFTPELETQQAQRYRELFELFRANKQHITSVTFWGVSDERSWLNNEPVKGRTDYPLLWDAMHKPKAALQTILDVAAP